MEVQLNNIPQQQSPLVTRKIEMLQLKVRLLLQLFRIIVRKTGNPLSGFRLIRQIRIKYRSTFGDTLLTKAAKVDNRYYWRLGTPGFPSKALAIMHLNEVDRFFPEKGSKGMRTLLFAITKECPMNCEHCFEWDNLNQSDILTTEDIIQIVHKYQDFGTTQIMLSGGEPMLRVHDIYKVLDVAKPGSDFWIFTSGLGFNADHAQQLKNAGLTGIIVSLDHFEKTKHNKFRGDKNAYDLAINAVVNANHVGLVTALTLCATSNFITESNMGTYMDLAKQLGVTFVQILEPRSKGRYAKQDVNLKEKHIQILEKTYLDYNSLDVNRAYPIINYLGYHQRRVGCFGAGNRFFYVDTDGDAQICPYCSKKVGNTLRLSAKEIIELLVQQNCHVFNKSTNL